MGQEVKVGDAVNIFGKWYVAVLWSYIPAEYFDNGGDPQCRVCGIGTDGSNCAYRQWCHGSQKWVFVMEKYVIAMSMGY